MEDIEIIMDEIKQLSIKLDNIPNVIREEIRSATIKLGLDPSKPTEAQELISYLRSKKRRDDQISKKMVDKFSGFIFSAFIILVCGGVLYYYSGNLISTAVKKELGLVDPRRHYKTEDISRDK